MELFNTWLALEAFEKYVKEHPIDQTCVEVIRAKLTQAAENEEFFHIFYILMEDIKDKNDERLHINPSKKDYRCKYWQA